MDYKKAYQLATIIVKVKLGTAIEKEREYLLSWLDESELNRQTYKRIIRGEAIRQRLQAEDYFEQKQNFEAICNLIANKLYLKKRKRRFSIWGSVAAAVCVGVIIMNLIYEKKGEGTDTLKSPQLVENIQNSRVKLILESGKQIDLENGIPEKLELNGTHLVSKSGTLTYKSPQPDKKSSDEVMNKIVTSVGGEYVFTLSDGTRVWLNAESELEFPVDFIHHERVVKLSGEAYFEVASNAEKPFVVETNGMKTRVLGTSFNVKAYGNEPSFVTTLLTGKVEVSLNDGKKSIDLEPGSASYWHKETGRLNSRKVNVKNAVAWRYGSFVFEDEDIEVVMRVLSRWYGVEFVFDGGRQEKYTFNGKISKDNSLNEVLKMLTCAGGPDFCIEGNVIHAIEKK